VKRSPLPFMQGPSSSSALRRSSNGGGGSTRLIYFLAASAVLMMAVPLYAKPPPPPSSRPRRVACVSEPCCRYLLYRIHSASSVAFAPSLSPWVARAVPAGGTGAESLTQHLETGAAALHWNEGEFIPRHRQNGTAAAAPAAVAAAFDPNIELPMGSAIALMLTGQVRHVTLGCSTYH